MSMANVISVDGQQVAIIAFDGRLSPHQARQAADEWADQKKICQWVYPKRSVQVDYCFPLVNDLPLWFPVLCAAE